MKKAVSSFAISIIAISIIGCQTNKPDIGAIKKLAYDSARQILLDSLQQLDDESEQYKEQQIQVFQNPQDKHDPPFDGHVHDGGFGLIAQAASGNYVSGTMHKIKGRSHKSSGIVATIPFIVKRGLINPGDDYHSDTTRHVHLEYDLVDLPLLSSRGIPTRKTVKVAFITRVIPK